MAVGIRWKVIMVLKLPIGVLSEQNTSAARSPAKRIERRQFLVRDQLARRRGSEDSLYGERATGVLGGFAHAVRVSAELGRSS